MTYLDQLVAALENPQALSELIPHASKVDLDWALSIAALAGNLSAVQTLIPEIRATGGGARALVWAAHAGHHSVVAELIPSCRLKDASAEALREAAKNGHLDTARALIPLGNVTARSAVALRLAFKEGHTRMTSELIRDSDVPQVFQHEVAHALENDSDGSFELIDRLSGFVSDDDRWDALYDLNPLWRSRTPTLKAWFDAQELREQLERGLP